MASTFITKRPHKKSRGGCKTCKTKKVKCDEVQPECGFCSKRNIACHYPAPKVFPMSPSPSDSTSSDFSVVSFETADDNYTSTSLVASPYPSCVTSSGTLTPLNLRAMHFWSVFTSSTIAPSTAYSQEVLQVTVPQLAFENDFLMQVMLGISSLHMQSVLPDAEQSRNQTDIYRAQAFNSFREALSRLDTNRIHTWEAALVTGILLTILCSRDYALDEGCLTINHWLNLYRGLSSVIKLRTFDDLLGSKVAKIFRRSVNDLYIEPTVPMSLYRMVEDIDPLDSEYKNRDLHRSTLNLIGILYASLQQEGTGADFQTRVVAWPSFVEPGFSDLARENNPRALILLAYHMCFVKLMKSLWWVEGVPDRDINQIVKLVPTEWHHLLRVPQMIVRLTSLTDMVAVLLNSVNEQLSPLAKVSAEQYKFMVGWYKDDTTIDGVSSQKC